MDKRLVVGSRASPLAQAQVQEVLSEIQKHFQIHFDCRFVLTLGDKDRQTSLRTLGKTDFFTKEIDEMLLREECRIAIHSAKDLPDPLPSGIALIAITKGVDPADALVLREHQTLSALPFGAIIATSSGRREDAVKELRPDFHFIDLRGTIAERLLQLEQGRADGVVVAEAALIRLGLTHRNRIKLPGLTAPLQGQLAITARAGDEEMERLFAKIDSRQ